MAEVTVVIATHDRSGLLGPLVAALRAQDHADFEAVIVDDASTDATGEVLAAAIGDDPRFRVLRSAVNRGPGHCRNLGWQAATTPWIAFTDDDCLPAPTWLGALLRTGAAAEIVQGTTRPAGPLVGWFDTTIRIESWSGLYETCNLLVRRDVLARHDGFDERFPPTSNGEDTHFGLRAAAGGARTAFAADAVAVHRVWPGDFGDFLRRRRRYAEAVLVIRDNPQGRSLLAWRFAIRKVHVLVWALVPLVVVAGALRAPFVALVPVVGWVALNAWRTRNRPFPLIRRLWYSTLTFVGYAYETACFALASVRHRTIVV